MPQTKLVRVSELALDLHNYRTISQPDEQTAIEAIISTSPDRFWALTDSLLQDGYLPTESVIVLRGNKPRVLSVREGNRRVAALKLIHGILPLNGFTVPDDIRRAIKAVSADWRRQNAEVPCTIYEPTDAQTVDRIVTLAHGKGEKAGRDQWNAVARARHNRDANNAAEPALDLLEAYLKEGRNVTAQQKARWAGAYPLSILAEAMKRLAPRLARKITSASRTPFRRSCAGRGSCRTTRTPPSRRCTATGGNSPMPFNTAPPAPTKAASCLCSRIRFKYRGNQLCRILRPAWVGSAAPHRYDRTRWATGKARNRRRIFDNRLDNLTTHGRSKSP
ncbi:MAG: hypothetical protein GEV06_01950 [Luteitalea sp.]|nr:hypothetical protein [Luteitalea sp.]